jgi:hypothetical protein
MKRPAKRYAQVLTPLAVVICAGCAEQTRSTFDIQVPRVYVWTYFDPEQLGRSMEADGLSVERGRGSASGLFVVRGTGTLKCPLVQITVRENGIVANGIEVESRAGSYRNLIIGKDGRVRPDAFLPFEPWIPFMN